jgi:hypothetical protein
MSGGYISCADFEGEDKSGSAMEGVLQGIVDRLPPKEADAFKREVVDVIKATLGPDSGVRVERPIAELLLPPLRAYYLALDEKLGHPEPSEAIDLDAAAGLDPIEAKYGAGEGWRFYCAADLLKACEISRRTGQPITVTFD